jgi:DNA mismatch repair ATPase MutS
MKAFLMYKNKDLELNHPLPMNEAEITQDLEMLILLNSMAMNDKFLFEVCKKTIFLSLEDINSIHYRQDVLKDCLKNPAIVRSIYQIPLESIRTKQKSWMGIFSRYPAGILSSSLDLLQMFIDLLKKLRQIADEHAEKFESEGFTTFFNMIKKELDDEYFLLLEKHLKILRFRNGVLISAELGPGTEGRNYLLRKSNDDNQSLIKRLFLKKSPEYSFSIHPRDEHGNRALSELRDRGIDLVANAVAQSADHIDSFFNMLRMELAFYIGCLNLYEQLKQLDYPVTFPNPLLANEPIHRFEGLYDVCLALTMKQKVIGNEVNAENKDLIIITGANQGGKSTFLRSIGLAQLMMQCGMFVPAERFNANLCTGVFTHFKRKEDASMKSGKLDEELSRMSMIIDHAKPNGMMLFNESFAATNEREGSEIARQITQALIEKQIKVFFVTHQYEFASRFYEKQMDNALFLCAERKADGERTYKLAEGEPKPTSYGEDIFYKVFKNGTLLTNGM